MSKENLQELAESQKVEASQDDKGKRILEQRDVAAFCKVARKQGCGDLANRFEVFAGLTAVNIEIAKEREKRLLRDQKKVIETRLFELNKMS